MKLTNLQLKDFIKEEIKLTFLVGAGCSIDDPSCLPAGRAMMDAIIDYVCPDTEAEKIKNLKELRFEALVEIVRDNIDNDLKLIDYYGLCDKPNSQHFFFAEMIKKGHFVMTTNFDFLIENALINLGIPKDEIIVAITREDFQEFSDPYELYKDNKKTLYKIHGSTKNVITGTPTKDSLIATMQAFGSNKEGLNIFQIESFKQKLFKNITSNRSLIIIGYSGSDDFDVVPTLKVLKNLREVFWINFKADDGGFEQVYEIDETSSASDKISQILIELKQNKNADRVYRIEANTSRMIKTLLGVESRLSPDIFSIKPHDWLKTNIELPQNKNLNTEFKYGIASEIFSSFGMFEDSLRCEKYRLEIAKKEKDRVLEGIILRNIGLNYSERIAKIPSEHRTNRNNAIANFLKAFKIFEKMGELKLKSDMLCIIGKYYPSIMRSRTSTRFYRRRDLIVQKIYEEILEIDKNVEDSDYLSLKAGHLKIIADYFSNKENYEKALNLLEEALKIYEQQGDLRGKSNVFHSIGVIYFDQMNFKETLARFELSLQVLQQLGLGNDHPSIKAVKDNINLLKLKEKNKSQVFSFNKAMEELIKATAKEDEKRFGVLIKIFDQLKNKFNEKLFSKLHKVLLKLLPEYYALEFYLGYLISYRKEYSILKKENQERMETNNQIWMRFFEELYNNFRMISENYSKFLEKNKVDNREEIKAGFLIILDVFKPEISEQIEKPVRLGILEVFETFYEKKLMGICISIQRAIYGIRDQEETLFKLILGNKYEEYFDKIL